MKKNDSQSLSKIDKVTLEFLLDEIHRAFLSSKEERILLHEMEWKADVEAPSILGESEAYRGIVCGVATAFLSSGVSNKHRDQIMARSTHCSHTMHDFFKKMSPRFPHFGVYLQAVEHLRAVLQQIMCYESVRQSDTEK